MKVNELRLGNYFQLEKDVLGGGVCRISKVKDFIYLNQLINSNGVKPIPLTEEWLLKFGFNKEGNTIYKELNGFEFGTINTNRYKPRFYLQTQGSTSNITLPIKFVHQLQNLYFALTGEELKQ